MGAVVALAPAPAERFNPEVATPAEVDGPGTLVVDLVDGSDLADLAVIEQLLVADLDWVHPLAVDEALAVGQVADVDDAMRLLAGHPLVEVAEADVQMEAFAWPDDPMYDKQWNLRAMGAPQGWMASPKGEGIIVAVVDTGVSKVEDLKGTEILKGETFVPLTKSADDDQGHGTHVAGTIAQTTNNGVGVAGVAPEATILPVKVLSRFGFGSSAWIAAGIDYAADNGADVINLSLGGPYSAVVHIAVKKARKKGVIVVAAAGNSGREGVGYPGALAETIGVSATGPEGTLAPYSSWGKGVDIAAPGGDKTHKDGGILQDTIDGRGGHHYVEYQGTSMASPHVAGAAAVLLSQGVPADAVERVILDTARGTGWDPKMGHGQLDLGAALTGTIGRFGATRFVLGILLALLATQLAGVRGSFRVVSAALSGVFAGGLFVLPWFGVGDAGVLGLLARGVLEWPAVLLGPDWMHFPLWLSAAVPLVAAFLLGPIRATRPVALALCAGPAAVLFHGAATGALTPWWLPGTLGTSWLVLHAAVAVLLALALAGTQKLDEEAA
jgi:serine protease